MGMEGGRERDRGAVWVRNRWARAKKPEKKEKKRGKEFDKGGAGLKEKEWTRIKKAIERAHKSGHG